MKYWGRIFFIKDPQTGQIQTVKGQPLDNHVGNCHTLLKQFDSKYFQDSSTKDRLIQAVKQHDKGKQTMFKLLQKKDGTFSYSFSGHRFHVPGHDPYVDALIRSHHEFSVERINRERAKFAKGSAERKHFADDLYLLCMADQLEAELAVKSIEGERGEPPRTFMEFVTERYGDSEQPVFTVIPWPFASDKFTVPFDLCIPRETCFAGISAKELQEKFKKDSEFEEEQVEIILRRS